LCFRELPQENCIVRREGVRSMFSGNVHAGFLSVHAEKWTRPRTLQFSCELPGILSQNISAKYNAYAANPISTAETYLPAGNRNFVKTRDEIKIRHTYRETAGSHAWAVWRGYRAEIVPLFFERQR
jgi:hypothetical protein